MKTVGFHLHHKSEIFRSAQRAQFFICFTLAKFVDPKSWKTQQILIKIKYSAVCVQCNFYTAIALGACDKYILLQKSGLGLRVKCAHPIWRNVKPCFWIAPTNGNISCVLMSEHFLFCLKAIFGMLGKVQLLQAWTFSAQESQVRSPDPRCIGGMWSQATANVNMCFNVSPNDASLPLSKILQISETSTLQNFEACFRIYCSLITVMLWKSEFYEINS